MSSPNLNKGYFNLDFIVDGPGPYKYVDVKNPIDPRKFPSAKKQPESFDKMAKRIGENIKNQKGGSDGVLHVADLEQISSQVKKMLEKKLSKALEARKIFYLLTKKIKMPNTFRDIIATFDNSKNLKIVDQAFANEIIVAQDLSISVFGDLKFSKINFYKVNSSGSYFTNCKFENCTFEKTVMQKSEFTDCKFKSCNLINSSFSKVEFDNSFFTDCQFYKVNSGWSCCLECIIRKTKFEQVDFESATLSNLKIKNLIVLNLKFTETFPTKLYKSNSNEFIEVKSQSNFEKILKDMNLILSNDQDDIENS